jgi:hypothetical protein
VLDLRHLMNLFFLISYFSKLFLMYFKCCTLSAK